MIRSTAVLGVIAALATSPAAAKCSDEIKALQQKAAGRDAAVKPGSQTDTPASATPPSEGGGQASASAKILEAQAHDQRGDEAECMKAIDQAKTMTK